MTHRRGFTLIEVVAAAAVLGGVTLVCAKFMASAALQQEAMRDRSRAAQLAANVMERLAVMPWEKLTAENVRPMQSGDDLRQVLPDGKIEIQIVQPPDEPDAKQVLVLVHCPSPPDAPLRAVRLVAWRYRMPGR
jgi:prepilin-type N-terminal cleavage/methylation domain-containing protein